MALQLSIRSADAPLMLMPLLRVNVVLQLMVTGAEGLWITTLLHVTAAPRVFVQFAGVATVESQIALSPAPGAMLLTQLLPDSKLLLLFALIWSARAANTPEIRARLNSAERQRTTGLAASFLILFPASPAVAPRALARWDSCFTVLIITGLGDHRTEFSMQVSPLSGMLPGLVGMARYAVPADERSVRRRNE